MHGLAGKRALVTGGAQGIGRAIALALAREGCDVALIDVDAAASQATLAEIRALGRAAMAVAADVSNPARCAPGSALSQRLPRRSTFSSTMPASPAWGLLLEISEQDWRDSFAVNVDGLFHVTRAVVPGMVARRRGAVVNLASWLGRRGNPHFAAYAASKFAVIGLTQCLAAEVAASGVRVNAVCPGIIADTPMRAAIDAASKGVGLGATEERVKAIPLRRAGSPEEVAQVAVFLASDAAAYVTGAAYDVSGGHWMT